MNRSGFIPFFVAIAITLIAVLAAGGFIVYRHQHPQTPAANSPAQSPGNGQAACPALAKQCPDGSYVGMTGPDCEFAACPSVQNSASSSTSLIASSTVDTSAWKTCSDNNFGFEFQCPNGWLLLGEASTSYGGPAGSLVEFGISSSSPSAGISIEIFNALPGESIATAFQRITTINLSGFAHDAISIGGEAASYYESIPGNVPYAEAMMLHGERFYGIIHGSYLRDSDAFKKILSTFKFVSAASSGTGTPSSTQYCATTQSQRLNRIYLDQKTGVSFKYPDFDGQATIVVSTDFPDTQTFEIDLPSIADKYPTSQFALSLSANNAHLSFKQWFQKYVDLNGDLITSGAFVEHHCDNGINILSGEGVFPADDNDLGPLPPFYAMSPKGDYAVAIRLSQVTELDMHGYTTGDSVHDLFRAILGSMQFP